MAVRTLDLVVFSHLRWGFVYQRPQHLLSRLATSRRVLFIEEPIPGASGEPRWEIEAPAPNVTVCRLHSPSPATGFSADQIEWMQPAVRELLDQEGFANYAAWF